MNNFKLIVGCSEVIGSSRNYNDTWEGNTDKDRILLFDLSKDQLEENNIAEEFPDVVRIIRERLDVHLARSVDQLHAPDDPAGHPSFPFPIFYFTTGWCEPIRNPSSKKSLKENRELSVSKEEL